VVGRCVRSAGSRHSAFARREVADPGARPHSARPADEEGPRGHDDPRLQALRHHYVVRRPRCSRRLGDRIITTLARANACTRRACEDFEHTIEHSKLLSRRPTFRHALPGSPPSFALLTYKAMVQPASALACHIMVGPSRTNELRDTRPNTRVLTFSGRVPGNPHCFEIDRVRPLTMSPWSSPEHEGPAFIMAAFMSLEAIAASTGYFPADEAPYA
jgi:hypothetical protein